MRPSRDRRGSPKSWRPSATPCTVSGLSAGSVTRAGGRPRSSGKAWCRWGPRWKRSRCRAGLRPPAGQRLDPEGACQRRPPSAREGGSSPRAVGRSRRPSRCRPPPAAGRHRAQAQRAAGGDKKRARQRHGDAVDVASQVIERPPVRPALAQSNCHGPRRGEDIAAGPAQCMSLTSGCSRIAGREPVRVGMVGLPGATPIAKRSAQWAAGARPGDSCRSGRAARKWPCHRPAPPAAIAGLCRPQAREHQVEPADRQRQPRRSLHRAKPVRLQCPAGPVDDLQRDPWCGCLWCGVTRLEPPRPRPGRQITAKTGDPPLRREKRDECQSRAHARRHRRKEGCINVNACQHNL